MVILPKGDRLDLSVDKQVAAAVTPNSVSDFLVDLH
jgi:hypothetical protein